MLLVGTTHPRDEFISFDEDTHTYTIRGSSEGVISATTFIHEFFSKFDADVTIARMMKNVEKFQNGPYAGMSVQEIKDEWEQNRLNASQLGTQMHKSIEAFYKYGTIPDPMPVEFSMFQSFHNGIGHLEPYRSEWSIYIEELKLAGQLDMLYKVKNKNTFVLCDWKRSKSIEKKNPYRNGLEPVSHLPDCNFSHYSLQLNLYKYILETYYEIHVSEMYLVVLHPTQDVFLQYEVPNLQKEIENLLETRRYFINSVK